MKFFPVAGVLTLILGVQCSPLQSHPAGRIGRIPVPRGYNRLVYPPGSFSDWLQKLPLKKENIIRSYTGALIEKPFYRVMGVVDMPLLFSSDLEQCADYCFRFWAEYHRARGRLERLVLFDYNGRALPFAGSGKSFTGFLKKAMSCANSFSIKKGADRVRPEDLMPGDMIVQNQQGGIGHVSMIMDACRNGKGQTLYLIGYSFMPAQEFHIEKASESFGMAGWFSWEGYRAYLKKHLDYGSPVLRRFPSSHQ